MQPASKNNNYHYNKKLRPLANNLRNQMTKAEASLWKYVLRAKMLNGYQFRRQRPVLNYIADFMAPELMLIIHYHPKLFQHCLKRLCIPVITLRNFELAGK